ncbi:DUF3275 family protein [Serratia ficaria]
MRKHWPGRSDRQGPSQGPLSFHQPGVTDTVLSTKLFFIHRQEHSMLTLPGQLAIKTIHGRNGDFNVGRLTTTTITGA